MEAAWRISIFSVAWTVAAGSAAIALGIAQEVAVLVAIGSVGLVDAIGSAALAYHFHHGLQHDALADHLERLAHRVVIIGLVAAGAGAVVLGGVRLLGGHSARSSVLATALTAVSLLVLVILARVKRRLAALVGSTALRSDGNLSAAGAAQSAVAILGVLATSAGRWWADPVATVAVGVLTVAIGVRAGRGEH